MKCKIGKALQLFASLSEDWMKSTPAWLGGSLTSKPTRRNPSGCSTASAFLLRKEVCFMFRSRPSFAVVLSACVAALLLVVPIDPAAPGNPAKPIQIGISNTFFHGIPQVFVKIAADDFKDLFALTGLTGAG